MLDLLLTRALQATGKLCTHPLSKLPTQQQLELVRNSDQFKDYILDALVWIDNCDGRSALSDRQAEIVLFGKLLSYVLWQLQHTRMSVVDYYNLLSEDEN